jgi:hypothetical protein
MKTRETHESSSRKTEAKRSIWRSRSRWEHHIQMEEKQGQLENFKYIKQLDHTFEVLSCILFSRFEERSLSKCLWMDWQPLSSSGKSSWLQTQRSRVRFWEVVGLERGSLSLVRITEELLEWKSSSSGSRKSRLPAVWIRCAHHANPVSGKVGTNFADKRRSLGRYSSLAD